MSSGQPRVMYMLALAGLVATRMALLEVHGSYVRLLAVAVAMGAAKGVRTVYMILVIPGHVDIEKLPSAAGLRSVANMCVMLVLGPLVGECSTCVFGVVYNVCIHLICSMCRLHARPDRRLCALHCVHERHYVPQSGDVDSRNAVLCVRQASSGQREIVEQRGLRLILREMPEIAVWLCIFCSLPNNKRLAANGQRCVSNSTCNSKFTNAHKQMKLFDRFDFCLDFKSPNPE